MCHQVARGFMRKQLFSPAARLWRDHVTQPILRQSPRGEEGRWTYLQLPSSIGSGVPVAISGCVCTGTSGSHGLARLGRLEAGIGRLACGRALWQVCTAVEHTTLSKQQRFHMITVLQVSILGRVQWSFSIGLARACSITTGIRWLTWAHLGLTWG